jgi:hypothetical protein
MNNQSVIHMHGQSPSIQSHLNLSLLRRVKSALRLASGAREARTRTIIITTTQPSATQEKPGAQPSASSAPTPKSNPANGFAAQSLRTAAHHADGSGQGNAPTVRDKPLKTNAETAADGTDANLPHRSAREILAGSHRPSRKHANSSPAKPANALDELAVCPARSSGRCVHGSA